MDVETMRQQLLKRLTDNYTQYRAGLLLKDRQELIDEAPHIAKTAEVVQYLAEWKCSERDLAYLLKFQNPLEVVTDRWESCTFDLDALGALVTDMADKEAELGDYPLMPESLLDGGLYLINNAMYLHIQKVREDRVACTLYDRETMRKVDHWIMHPGEFMYDTPDSGTADARFAVFAEHGVNVVSAEAAPLGMLQKLKSAQLDSPLDEYPRPDYLCTMTDIARRGCLNNGLLPVSDNVAQDLFRRGFAIFEVTSHGKIRGPVGEDYLDRQNFGGIFAVSRVGWQNSRMFQELVAERMDHQMERELTFRCCSQDCFAIYQLNHHDPELRDIRYESLGRLQDQGQRPHKDNYELVYTAFLPEGTGLNTLWTQFNTDHPPDYQHPSLSISDVIAVKKNGTVTCYYVNQGSYAVLDDFFDQGAHCAERPGPDHKASIKTQIAAAKVVQAETPTAQQHQTDKGAR